MPLPLTARPWREWRPLGVQAVLIPPCKNRQYQRHRILKISSWISGNRGFVRNERSTTEKQNARIHYIFFIYVCVVKLFKSINTYHISTHTKCSIEPRDDSLETFLHALADRPQYIKSSHSIGTADPTAGSHWGPSNFITITTCCHGSGYVVIRFGSNDKLASGHRTSSSTVCPSYNYLYILKILHTFCFSIQQYWTLVTSYI